MTKVRLAVLRRSTVHILHDMLPLAITWLGHSSFVVRTPGGKTVLFDPWYTGNPSFPAGARSVPTI